MRTLVIALIALHFVGPSEAAETCSAAHLQTQCPTLSGVQPEDTVIFANGFRAPACMTAAGSASFTEPDLQHIRTAYGFLTEVVTSPALLRNDMISTDLISGLHRDSFDLRAPKTMDWPPNVPLGQRTRTVVTPEVANGFWRELLGAEAHDKLRQAGREFALVGVRASEWTQRSEAQRFDMSGQAERRARLFGQAKEAAIRRILRGRQESSLSTSERVVLTRVRRVSLAPIPIPSSITCGDPEGGAFDPTTEQVKIEPRAMFFPDESIVVNMLHEIAHQVDLCRLETLMRDRPADFVSPFLEVDACLRSAAGGGFGGSPAGFPSRNDATCRNPHSREAFCDWFAADVVENDAGLRAVTSGTAPSPSSPTSSNEIRLPRGFERDFTMIDLACSDDGDGETHPASIRRVVEIKWRQPSFATPSGCQVNASTPACSLESTSASSPIGPARPRAPVTQSPASN